MNNRSKISGARYIYLVGSVVIFTGILFIGISTSLHDNSLIIDITRDVGIALIIAGSVGLALEYHLQTHTLKDIEYSISDTVNVVKDAIHKEEELLGECKRNGLIKVYEPHSKTGLNSDFDRDIMEQFKKEKNEIKIYGISARHFFHHERKYYADLREATKRGLSVKVLLLDPFSKSAKKRACLEERIGGNESYFQSKLCTEIMLSALTIDKGAIAGLNKENVRFYRGEPAFFLFICSGFLIMEPYHFGKIQTDEIGILGGHVPAFMFKSDSDAYVRLSAHFDNCFGHASRGLSETIKEYEAVVIHLSNSIELT